MLFMFYITCNFYTTYTNFRHMHGICLYICYVFILLQRRILCLYMLCGNCMLYKTYKNIGKTILFMFYITCNFYTTYTNFRHMHGICLYICYVFILLQRRILCNNMLCGNCTIYKTYENHVFMFYMVLHGWY